ncbi:hypothetical protein ACFQY7_56190 [Actinomadura luteofluorescens]|uniref:hypothetical protein n=1 Tax=Actinomadura luteofluorescens TaxID=46163 RepID=UPI00363AF286
MAARGRRARAGGGPALVLLGADGPGRQPGRDRLPARRPAAGRGPGGDLSGNTFYQGGYPLLLTPAFWFSHDPATVYTTVMAINAVLGAALFPLGYAAARRFGLARRRALPLAFAAALLPATTFFGAFALADAVLPTLVLAWLLALDRFVRNGRAGDAALASLAASCAAAVHTRGTVLLAVHAAALLVMALTGRRRIRAALAGAAVALAGYAAGAALNAHVRAELYPRGTRDLGEILASRLTTVPGQEWALSGAAGQLWYLIVSTWGLAGAGLVAVAAVLARRRTPAADRIMAGVLLAATCGIAYASSAALPDEHRVGNFAYGRYLACVALVYALAGAAALARLAAGPAIRLAAAGALLLEGAALWVTAYAGERLRTHIFIGFDFPEVTFLTADRSGLHLHEATFAALALLGGLLALSRLDRTALASVALAGVNLAALTFAMGPHARRVPAEPPLPGPATGRVVTDSSLNWAVRVALLYPVWWTRVGAFDVRAGRPPHRTCARSSCPSRTGRRRRRPGRRIRLAGGRTRDGSGRSAGWAGTTPRARRRVSSASPARSGRGR